MAILWRRSVAWNVRKFMWWLRMEFVTSTSYQLAERQKLACHHNCWPPEGQSFQFPGGRKTMRIWAPWALKISKKVDRSEESQGSEGSEFHKAFWFTEWHCLLNCPCAVHLWWEVQWWGRLAGTEDLLKDPSCMTQTILSLQLPNSLTCFTKKALITLHLQMP